MRRWRLPAVVGVCLAAAVITSLLWWSARERRDRAAELERETRLTAVQLAARLRSGLDKHRIALEQFASFIENDEGVSDDEFDRFASKTLTLTPLCLRIPEVDSTYHITRVFPRSYEEGLVGFDVHTHPTGFETNLRARSTRRTALSVPLDLIGGTPGFILVSPLFHGTTFAGNLICTFRSRTFFESMVAPQITARYEVEILDAKRVLYRAGRLSSGTVAPPPVVQAIDFGGRRWLLRIEPREQVATAYLSSGSVPFWLMGCMLALAAGGAGAWGVRRATRMAARVQDTEREVEATTARLDQATQQLMQAEKLTALGELVAGVAHEINNPLTSILGYTQLLLAKETTPEVRRRLETISEEAERSGRIVRNLLTFARKQPPEKRLLGLNGIVEKTLDLKAYQFRVNQIVVEKDLERDLPKSMLDYHQIQQVLLNLLNNAEQAMTENGSGGLVRISTRAAGERIELRVADSGPGIPDDVIGRLFEPFFTTKKEGKGTGLGLSLCYGIVQEHGGTITVDNVSEGGAVFRIALPVAGEPARVSEAGPAHEELPARARHLRVFVVDDEAGVQSLLVDLLTAQGHSVDTASDVPEAVRKIASNDYDLIIADMRMPHGTGVDIYRAAERRDPGLARRVVFTTGDGASAGTRSFLENTGNEILLKPCRIEEIHRAIRRAMGD